MGAVKSKSGHYLNTLGYVDLTSLIYRSDSSTVIILPILIALSNRSMVLSDTLLVDSSSTFSGILTASPYPSEWT